MVPILSLVVPSPQPHPELLSIYDAAPTLANLLTYSPPAPSSPLPRKVRSAAVVAMTQRGEAAECALVLASVLLGAGYRAFVAQGIASPSLVAGDTSTLSCPYLAPPQKRQVTCPTLVEPNTGKITLLPTEEPLPFLCLHALFNHSNYWASTQPRTPLNRDTFNLDDRSLWLPLIDDGSGKPNERPQPKGMRHKPSEPSSHTKEHEDTQQASHDPQDSPTLLQRFPGGWREEVYREAVVRRYAPLTHPRGTTLALTLRTPEGSVKEVREEFQQRQDRLVGRITDLNTGAVRDTFSRSRKDTLKEHQYWREPISLGTRVGPDGVDNPWQASELEVRGQTQPLEVFLFHSEFRVDALRRREVRSGEWREEYDARADLLLRRTVTFASASSRAVQKIEEEFESPDKGCSDDSGNGEADDGGSGDGRGRGMSSSSRGMQQSVQRRVMMVTEGRVHLLYHYGRHRLLQPSRTFVKPQDGLATSLTMEHTHSFQPDPGAEEPKLPQLWEELEVQMEAEARALVEVRQAVEETEAIKEARVSEEEQATLLPGIFDTTSNATVQQILKERAWEEAHREETERKKREELEGRVDIIAPYLPLLQVSCATSTWFVGGEGLEEAVQERCLQDLRDRLALRANLLQDKLDEAREAVLTCREEVSRRKRVTAEERAALNAETAAAEAAHRRLRAHLAAWRHEAEERYETMAAKLEIDSRIRLIPSSGLSSPPPDTVQGSTTSPSPRR
ncbi:Dynein regulatory complex subunit 7 [Portunus trituberculatus]|uniref:Dynein regulatory complex subunit 7 n=1 Tax=Portunus trituberculatus TaxID=210409 RepID=A0A5B7CES9_PORTR|nr:Dynein regulatory complex subunit 7 [Portunus trituberculatus]